MIETKPIEDYQGMTNSETGMAIGGVVIAAAGAVVGRADQIEQYLRMGASAVAIASGCVVLWSVLYKHFKKKGK